MILERISSNYIKLYFFGKTIENVRNPIKKSFLKNTITKKLLNNNQN